MPLIRIVLTLVVVGVVLGAINACIPMAQPVKTLLTSVVVVVICLWLLKTFGIIDSVRGIRVR